MHLSKNKVDDSHIVPDQFMLEQKRRMIEKEREFVEFLDLIHKVFNTDGTSKLALDIEKSSVDRIDRVYRMQQDHRKRIIFKHANDETFHGLPSYLSSFMFKQDNRAQEQCRLIIQNKFDELAKEEERQIAAMIKHVNKRRGGPPSRAYLESYPGDQIYIEHLRKRFDLIFCEPKLLPCQESSRNFFKVNKLHSNSQLTHLHSQNPKSQLNTSKRQQLQSTQFTVSMAPESETDGMVKSKRKNNMSDLFRVTAQSAMSQTQVGFQNASRTFNVNSQPEYQLQNLSKNIDFAPVFNRDLQNVSHYPILG